MDYNIIGLNSEDFGVFFTHGRIFILKSRVCRAFKIIPKNSKFGEIPWEFRPENSFLSFRVGVSIGGQDATNFPLISKDAQ